MCQRPFHQVFFLLPVWLSCVLQSRLPAVTRPPVAAPESGGMGTAPLGTGAAASPSLVPRVRRPLCPRGQARMPAEPREAAMDASTALLVG